MYFAAISADVGDGIGPINRLAAAGDERVDGCQLLPIAANCCQLLTPSIILTMLCLPRDTLYGMGQGLCAKMLDTKEAESAT